MTEVWDPRTIARQAKRDATLPSLEQGERVAWTERAYAGYTDGLSEIHTVYDKQMTYCEAELPDSAINYLPPLRSLERCLTCVERRASGWEKPVKKPANTASDLVRSVA